MRVGPKRVTTLALALILGAAAHAAPTLYFDRTSFLADGRTGVVTQEGFDTFALGTDLTGTTLGLAQLQAPGSTPLEVILGATGVRFPMSPSSGPHVLSPGGSSTTLEDDDLRIVFGTPVRAAGLDVVYDAPDGLSFVGVTFRDAGGNVLASNSFIPAPGGAPGYQFAGLVDDTASIASIAFDEFDPTADDDHVAYDTLTYAAVPVPEPVAFGPLAMGLGALLLRRCRKR